MTTERAVRVRELRSADPTDIAAVAEIRVRTWQAAYAGIVPKPYLDAMSVDVEVRRRRAALQDPGNPARVLLAEGPSAAPGVLGFATIGPSRDDDGEGAGEVYALYVRPDSQGHGAGRALLEHAVGQLRAAGYQRATLWVLVANSTARRFYERAGWRPDGARHIYAKTGAELPELRYEITLR